MLCRKPAPKPLILANTRLYAYRVICISLRRPIYNTAVIAMFCFARGDYIDIFINKTNLSRDGCPISRTDHARRFFLKLGRVPFLTSFVPTSGFPFHFYSAYLTQNPGRASVECCSAADTFYVS